MENGGEGRLYIVTNVALRPAQRRQSVLPRQAQQHRLLLLLRAAARDGAGLCVPLHHYGKSRWNGDLCRPLLHQRGQAGKNGRYIQEDSERH